MSDTEIPRGQRLRMRFAGADHLARQGVDLSPLGATVAEALGYVWRGIYHLRPSLLERVKWANPRCVCISVPTGLDTWDDDRLTRLVVVCHDLGLRLEVDAAGPKYLRLTFYQRLKREGPISERMPTLDDHVASIREGYEVVPTSEDA